MKKMLVGIIILLLLFPSVVSTSVNKTTSQSRNGNILYVGGSGPGNYTKIQDAIDNASDGDTVFIYNESSPYYENIEVDKSISILGEDRDTVILDDGGNEFSYGIMIQSDNTIIMNMTIQNYNLFAVGSGVKITDSSIQNIILKNLNVIDNWYGIILCSNTSQIRNIVLSNITIDNNIYGIRLISTTKCFISNCKFHSNQVGLALDSSNHNFIQNNIFQNNGLGLGMVGSYLSHYIHRLNGNTVNGKALLYFKNQTDLLLDDEAGQIILVNCSDVNIRNLTLNDTSFGVYTAFSNNITISNNSFSKSSIMLDKSKDSTIISNNIYDNHNSVGIGIVFSNNNIIISNKIHNNDFKAIRLYSSDNNIISENTIDNNELGIDFSSSNYNMIYHNNFINNSQNAYDECNNNWDDGYPSCGNFWDDYNGTDEDGDGIGDTPYPVPGGNNEDRYPLMHPYGSITNLETGEIFLTIQGAIDDSDTVAGHTIYVKNGTYFENVLVDKTINLLGEDRDSTIIDGLEKNVITIKAQRVTVTGFTIQNSKDYNGGGIKVLYDESIIKKNIIKDNECGIFLYFAGFSIISENIITNNNAEGIHGAYSNYNFILKNYITNNSPGIDLSFSNNNKIIQNEIENNWGGLQLYESGWNLILRNTFKKNNEDAFVSLDFRFHNMFINIWSLNYWNRARLLPKPILTRVTLKNDLTFPFFTFDWRPALKPYDIGV